MQYVLNIAKWCIKIFIHGEFLTEKWHEAVISVSVWWFGLVHLMNLEYWERTNVIECKINKSRIMIYSKLSNLHYRSLCQHHSWINHRPTLDFETKLVTNRSEANKPNHCHNHSRLSGIVLYQTVALRI